MDHAPRSGGPVGLDIGSLTPVLAYWQGLRRGRAVPARTDLDPVVLQPWLAGAGIVERDEGRSIRFRLGGRVIAGLLGVEPRGMSLGALFAVAARDRLTGLTEAVFDGPRLLCMTLVAPHVAAGKPQIEVPMVVMPLCDASGTVTRALVCVDVDARAGLALPCRFQIRQAVLSAAGPQPRLTGLRVARGGAPALRVIEGGRG
ncbi:PAS domain-containing protein [Roseicyclus mahoneyensis]|uniref:PAS domain-containing protein n=1 Tax=Roseicyclus mahoneyensis TaxID=164332 RepID=A0A316H524_9RHOB|nr:PAS domain-containing protein [Roseicyclus mahoneyensis]PWK62683.1 PAS domain-containing protein [Roseicyclus mahoneyensis]